MNDGEFYEAAIHTDISEVPNLRDHTAGQVLLKMAALEGGPLSERPGTVVSVRFTRNLGLEMVTPVGTYSFVLDSEGEHLVVEQIR
jgi:hypothetical protein